MSNTYNAESQNMKLLIVIKNNNKNIVNYFRNISIDIYTQYLFVKTCMSKLESFYTMLK